MKKQLLTAVIAMTGLAAFSSANAQTYTAGDSLLYFIAQSGTGASKNVQIDLGNLTSSSFSSYNFSSSALSTVLGSTFGANWYTLNTLSWGLIGSANATAVDLSGLGVTLGNTGANASGGAIGFGDLATIGSSVDPMYLAGNSASATKGTITDSLGGSHYYSIYDNGIQSSASSQEGLPAFGYFSGSLSGAVTTFNNNAIVFHGTADDGSGSGIATTPVTTGSFAVNNSTGVISVNAVPEPGTYALFGLGALLLVIAVRRKSHNA